VFLLRKCVFEEQLLFLNELDCRQFLRMALMSSVILLLSSDWCPTDQAIGGVKIRGLARLKQFLPGLTKKILDKRY
jgi:hypothetical protein